MRICLLATTVFLVFIMIGVFGACSTELSRCPRDELVEVSSDIRLNSLGFLSDMQKKASIVAKCSCFTVRKASNGRKVYSGTVTGPVHQVDVNEAVWIADFSKVNKKDRFYLDVPGVGRSFEFEIGDKVYDFFEFRQRFRTCR